MGHARGYSSEQMYGIEFEVTPVDEASASSVVRLSLGARFAAFLLEKMKGLENLKLEWNNFAGSQDVRTLLTGGI